MDGKRTMVTLVREVDGAPQEFEVAQAEAIMAIRRSGWALPEDSDFELKDGAFVKRNKKGNNGAKKA